MYSITYSDEALVSIAKFKKSNPASFKKTLNLVKELHVHPRTGTGHPEALKGYGGNIYSKEINKKDRLVYEIHEEVVNVYIISAERHYKDK